ncbi:calcium/sodium antiporter [Aquiflexum gelatinilyticum]|uniref:calcium/sodium antiporter n=1 Tax=Aquiflexum gelatinilyticum TaxID=2961943 RepID=UPI00216954F1|nr:calcium/sodium antiporter [Aquiflexum gelatinilyticum]MCS4434879.1 calcium/sodium antiporter [Aquiflexum gelatinilyticum]
MIYLFLCLGLIILLGGGKFLVDGASSLALKFGLSQGFIGLTIVAFGTSAPELLVSINAALDGKSDIAIGNVIGSNIANISLVLGISATLFPIKINSSVFKVDYLVLIMSSIIFYLLSYNGVISSIEGLVLLLILFLINLYFFYKLSKPNLSELESDLILPLPVWKSLLFLGLGIIGLYYGADLFVESAVVIASVFGVSERIIGITVIAIGTSLPEMATSIIAAINKKTDIAVGNILGSNIMNILAIIGATAVISPIPVSEGFLNQDFFWMLGFTFILYPILRTGNRVSRIEGVFLFIGYFTYIFIIL